MPRILLIILLLITTLSQYKVVDYSRYSTKISISLSYQGDDKYYLKNTSTIYNNLSFKLTCHSFNDISFQITDSADTRFEIPKYDPFQVDPFSRSTFPIDYSQFNFSYTNYPFTFKIVRRLDNEVVFDSTGSSLIFSKYYMEITTKTASRNIWGFGQRYSSNFNLQEGSYTIWNKDKGERVDHQQGFQTYGFYPAYLIRQQSGMFHMSHLRNSNAMDVIVSNDTAGNYKLTYKVIGGMFDFRFIMEDRKSPQFLIQRFHLYLGRSAVPPFWAMGFHQSRWGYENVSMLEDVAKGYETNDIPLDTLWTDIDYMVEFEDFTIDQARFPLDRMAKLWQKYHIVPIIDAGIKVGNGSGYIEGEKMDIFIKDPHGQYTKGFVWPGTTVFVDWFHPKANAYWSKMLGNLRAKFKFSGIWLDMNEISNFCDGPCVLPQYQKVFDYTHDIPYSPGTDTIQSDTISMNSTHFGNVSQADVHSFFGMMETYATHQYLKGLGLRPFVLTRSSTFGSNKYGFHWTGDNVASWEFLRNTINQNFMFQIWGIQMVGPDICGYTDNTTEELCSRWFQLGSFYPFARNHNDEDKTPQEAYALGTKVMKAARTNLKLRYSLLKEYYKLFVVQRGAGSIFKPLFFEFPNDVKAYQDDTQNTQFLIGNYLMGAPVVTEGATSRSVYFPTGQRWYGYLSGIQYQGQSTHTIDNEMTEPLLLFIRQGHVLFTQNTTQVTKTLQLDNTFHLVGALSYNNQSSSADMSVYTTKGSVLGLKDYNDELNLSLCLIEGCEFQVFMSIHMHKNGTTELDVTTTLVGAKSLVSDQKVKSLKLFYPDNKTLTYQFGDNPIIISKTGTQNFVLSNQTWSQPKQLHQ